MEEHDRESCNLCSKETAAPSNFYNGLFHYILEKGKLTDEQYDCIEDKVEAHSPYRTNTYVFGSKSLENCP